MKENNFWSTVANNTAWMLIGFCSALMITTDSNFWLIFLGELAGLFMIWVLCATLNALFGDPYEKK